MVANSYQPLVAVLTPVYNGGKYLEETMKSVQSQTYPNLVHVVVDNASSDATPDIISRYKNARIPVITKRNSNLLPQRDNYNEVVALAPAKVQYLKILAADDLMRQDAITQFVDVCERNPNVSVASCLDCYGGVITPVDIDPRCEAYKGRHFAQRALLGELSIPYHHMFWRRSAAGLGDFFSDDLAGFDAVAFQRLCLAGDVGFIFEPLVFTRVHDDTFTAAYVREGRHVWNTFNTILHIAEQFEPEIRRRAVRWALNHYLRAIAASALNRDFAYVRSAFALLREGGHQVGVLDHVLTLMDYPAYFGSKLFRRMRAQAAMRSRNFCLPKQWRKPAPVASE